MIRLLLPTRWHLLSSFAFGSVLAILTPTPVFGGVQGLTRVATGFDSPVFVTHAPGDANRLYVVEQSGLIRTLDLSTGSIASTPFLNIQGLVDDDGGEQGLLGLAFAPDYQTSGNFYVNYTRDPGPGLDRTRVDRFTTLNPIAAAPANTNTRSSVLEFNQDFSNHNGGWIGFSPKDNHLYIATGDGGSGNDPNNRAQSLNSRLGKILRVDPTKDDFPSNTTENYAVPTDNPFVNQSGLDEIWAYGLRNPWRNSFDRETGDLWLGDVGQGAREEINFQPADSNGGENYGWRLREGDISTLGGAGGPEPSDHEGPIYDYISNGAGSFGGNSVVGGYVYRGIDPDLQGLYFFGDSFPRQVWTFDPTDPDGTVQNIESLLTPNAGSLGTPVSFGEDFAGNLYIVDRDGDIFQIATNVPEPTTFSALLVVGSLILHRRK